MQLSFRFDDSPTPQADRAKVLGAYYTDVQVADFLSWWAIRTGNETVMDPSFGGGVFLRSACRRIQKLGEEPRDRVYGVELDSEVFSRIAGKLSEEFNLNNRHLICDDFFNVDPQETRRVDAIIGNPPFIRYQRFTSESRRHAFERVQSQGVDLPKLSSSWALFLVHSIAMLRPGGRLAMVLPMEVAHAKYARPVLNHLRHSFETTTFLTFRKKLFADLSEDTLLVLADHRVNGTGAFHLRDLANPGSLAALADINEFHFGGTNRLNAETIATGESRIIEHFLPAKARDLYRELRASISTRRLGELADVGIGYVTGANDFFHLNPKDCQKRGIPKKFLKPAVRRGRAISGVTFTQEDWRAATMTGEAGYLLHIPRGQELPPSVLEYLEMGRLKGVASTYKCRTRTPWFSVPNVYQPDAFLSYMSGATPHLVANQAQAYAPNSLHVVRLHQSSILTPHAIAALWHTSLTRLSAEIEGHPLGGGMLKLEPTEAENVVLPFPGEPVPEFLDEVATELDDISRTCGDAAAIESADIQLLQKAIGLSRSDCNLLRSAAETLRARRGYRRSTNELA